MRLRRIVSLLTLVPLLVGFTPGKLPSLRHLMDFSGEAVGHFPHLFRTYPFQRNKAMEVYSVQEDQKDRFLRASDNRDISVQIFLRFYWPSERWPWLSWRWRARSLPAGGDERSGRTNDSACGIYVVFGGYIGKALKYVWSSQAPQGSVIRKNAKDFYMFVMDSGPDRLNEWRTLTVNVREDYRKVFGEYPDKDPSGFGILTDGNATHSAAACDYDDFLIAEERSLLPSPR